MSTPNYPRGFVLGCGPENRPEGFVAGPLFDNFFVDPNLRVTYAINDECNCRTVVIGSCVYLEDDSADPAVLLLEGLTAGEGDFYELLDSLVGRFAVFYEVDGCIRVVGDATAMRPIFYAKRGGLVASHASLLSEVDVTCHEKDELPFSSSMPADTTPYEGVRILLPNFYLAFESGSVTRFWPREPLKKMSTEKAAHSVLELATASARALSAGRQSWLALTGGLDSRVSLAVMINAGLEPQTFTYGKNAGTRMDRKVASHLASRFGFKHFEIPTGQPDEELKQALEKAHYWNHHHAAVGPLRGFIAEPEAVVYSSNILEIGQSNYRKLQWRAGIDEPTTAGKMAAVYYRKLSRKAKMEIADFGKDDYIKEVTDRFQCMIDETGGPSKHLDPFDDYYWTFRMGTWHGPSSVEKDFYGEPMNPFNARCIIEPLLSVSDLDQYDLSVFMRLITLVDCRLLDVPINPSDLSWL